MTAIRGITVAVGDWYAATLEITLVRNMRHTTECLVVTKPEDEAVKSVVANVPGARVFETDAFTRHGAAFNKGLSLELGFEELGRHGTILIWDADILLPDSIPFDRIKPANLHGARRKILEDVSKWKPGLDWNTCPTSRDGGPIGYFQLFDADDPSIKDKRPWYDVTFAHAGGGDARFITHWPRDRHCMLPMEVLHLGPKDLNWFGLTQEARDIMAKFVTENGWNRAAANFRREQVERAGDVVHRVDVPGYDKSEYELPFVRRSQEKKAR